MEETVRLLNELISRYVPGPIPAAFDEIHGFLVAVKKLLAAGDTESAWWMLHAFDLGRLYGFCFPGCPQGQHISDHIRQIADALRQIKHEP